MNLAEMVREIRKSRNMSQEKLADLAGTSQSKISGIERGTANIELATLRAVCTALDAEVIVVPRRVSGAVMNVINSHLNRDTPTQYGPVQSVRDELFIPDGNDEGEAC
jgi:transcriptional regulator with XRE-family HTH domain